MAKDTPWFPHDYNARADEKTAALINDHTATGYGVFSILTEILHEEEGSRIEYSEKRLRRLAGNCKVDFDKFKAIIDDCINIYELWALQDGYFYSDRVIRNKEDRERIRQKKAENGKKGGEARSARNVANATNNQANARKNKALAKHSQAPAKQNVANPTTGQDNTEHNTSTNVEDIDISQPKDLIKEKKEVFKAMVQPFIESFGKDLCNDFWFYWTQPNKPNTMVRWESEKFFDIQARLRTFRNNEAKRNK